MTVTVLPAGKQSFGSMLGGSISQGLTQGFSDAFKRSEDDYAEEKKFSRLLQMEGKKQEAVTTREKEAAERKFQQEKELAESKQKHDIKVEKLRAGSKKEVADAKAGIKVSEGAEVKQMGQRSFDSLVDILEKGNVGYGSKISGGFGNVFGSGETAGDRGQFETLTGGLESMLVHKVNVGSLSQSRFDYITKQLLPNPGDTQKVIKNKLKALATILGLDASRLESGNGTNQLIKSGSQNGSKVDASQFWSE